MRAMRGQTRSKHEVLDLIRGVSGTSVRIDLRRMSGIHTGVVCEAFPSLSALPHASSSSLLSLQHALGSWRLCVCAREGQGGRLRRRGRGQVYWVELERRRLTGVGMRSSQCTIKELQDLSTEEKAVFVVVHACSVQ